MEDFKPGDSLMKKTRSAQLSSINSVTIACLHVREKCPSVIDELKIVVMYGAWMVMASFRSQVGRGSDAHCLLGEALTAVITSSMLTVLKLSNPDALPLVYCGGGADDVAALTSATFLLM